MYNAAPLGIGGKASYYYNAQNTNPVNPGGLASTVTNTWVRVPIDATNVPLANITSVQVDDPRLNMAQANWRSNPAGGNTFGSANFNSSLLAAGTPNVPIGTGEPQQDTDGTGAIISTASLYMPPPAGTTFALASGVLDDNTLGMVTSAGELGFIHTGIESSSYAFTSGSFYVNWSATFPPGVPWRTLRLQPNRDTASVVPDWAFIDLFTAPVIAPTGAEYIYAPGYSPSNVNNRDRTVGGRVNLNARPVYPAITRTAPLAAVLQGCRTNFSTATTLTPTAAAVRATNIYSNTISTAISGNYGKMYGYTDGYYSPGEIVEIAGIADGGESSEQLVREMGGLVTARGDVFTVFSVGQSLKQTPSGSIVVTGEQRLQAMIERYSDTNGIHFSPVYYRKLSP